MSRSSRVLGSLRTADGAGVLRIEDRFDTHIDDLWSALTDPQRLVRWYGEVAGDLRAGGRFTVHLEAAGLDALGHVEACEPPRRLRVVTRETDESWERGSGPAPFEQTVDVTLTPVGDRTDLVLEARGLPLETIAFFGAGWQIHAENLAGHVAGREAAAGEVRWGELVPAYQELAAALPGLRA